MEVPAPVQRSVKEQVQAMLARLDEVVLCPQGCDFGVPSD